MHERYHKRFARLLAFAGVPASIDFHMGWVHGSAHDWECEQVHSGLYREGTGRRVGEQSEQLWALVKHASQLARYMTLAHRTEFLEDTFRLVSDTKQRNFVDMLKNRFNAVVKLLCALCNRCLGGSSHKGMMICQVMADSLCLPQLWR